MKNQPKTVIQTLAERLREQAKRFNPSIETAPVAVLWTDDRLAATAHFRTCLNRTL
jgi:hypothetical protein